MRVQSKPSKKVAASGSYVVHNVQILDASGSMHGGKYESAIEGINADIAALKQLQKDQPEVKNTYSIVEFSSTRTDTHYLLNEITGVLTFRGRGATGGTPLYQTVGETIEKIVKLKKPEDKVILKIFTDGEENDSNGKYRPDTSGRSDILTALLKEVEKDHGFTVTFVGTKYDVENVINTLHIHASNTLVHNNTKEDVKKQFMKGIGARVSYNARLLAGEDVTANYYKGA